MNLRSFASIFTLICFLFAEIFIPINILLAARTQQLVRRNSTGSALGLGGRADRTGHLSRAGAEASRSSRRQVFASPGAQQTSRRSSAAPQVVQSSRRSSAAPQVAQAGGSPARTTATGAASATDTAWYKGWRDHLRGQDARLNKVPDSVLDQHAHQVAQKYGTGDIAAHAGEVLSGAQQARKNYFKQQRTAANEAAIAQVKKDARDKLRAKDEFKGLTDKALDREINLVFQRNGKRTMRKTGKGPANQTADELVDAVAANRGVQGRYKGYDLGGRGGYGVVTDAQSKQLARQGSRRARKAKQTLDEDALNREVFDHLGRKDAKKARREAARQAGEKKVRTEAFNERVAHYQSAAGGSLTEKEAKRRAGQELRNKAKTADNLAEHSSHVAHYRSHGLNRKASRKASRKHAVDTGQAKASLADVQSDLVAYYQSAVGGGVASGQQGAKAATAKAKKKATKQMDDIAKARKEAYDDALTYYQGPGASLVGGSTAEKKASEAVQAEMAAFTQEIAGRKLRGNELDRATKTFKDRVKTRTASPKAVKDKAGTADALVAGTALTANQKKAFRQRVLQRKRVSGTADETAMLKAFGHDEALKYAKAQGLRGNDAKDFANFVGRKFDEPAFNSKSMNAIFNENYARDSFQNRIQIAQAAGDKSKLSALRAQQRRIQNPELFGALEHTSKKGGFKRDLTSWKGSKLKKKLQEEGIPEAEATRLAQHYQGTKISLQEIKAGYSRFQGQRALQPKISAALGNDPKKVAAFKKSAAKRGIPDDKLEDAAKTYQAIYKRTTELKPSWGKGRAHAVADSIFQNKGMDVSRGVIPGRVLDDQITQVSAAAEKAAAQKIKRFSRGGHTRLNNLRSYKKAFADAHPGSTKEMQAAFAQDMIRGKRSFSSVDELKDAATSYHKETSTALTRETRAINAARGEGLGGEVLDDFLKQQDRGVASQVAGPKFKEAAVAYQKKTVSETVGLLDSHAGAVLTAGQKQDLAQKYARGEMSKAAVLQVADDAFSARVHSLGPKGANRQTAPSLKKLGVTPDMTDDAIRAVYGTGSDAYKRAIAQHKATHKAAGIKFTDSEWDEVVKASELGVIDPNVIRRKMVENTTTAGNYFDKVNPKGLVGNNVERRSDFIEFYRGLHKTGDTAADVEKAYKTHQAVMKLQNKVRGKITRSSGSEKRKALGGLSPSSAEGKRVAKQFDHKKAVEDSVAEGLEIAGGRESALKLRAKLANGEKLTDSQQKQIQDFEKLVQKSKKQAARDGRSFADNVGLAVGKKTDAAGRKVSGFFDRLNPKAKNLTASDHAKIAKQKASKLKASQQKAAKQKYIDDETKRLMAENADLTAKDAKKLATQNYKAVEDAVVNAESALIRARNGSSKSLSKQQAGKDFNIGALDDEALAAAKGNPAAAKGASATDDLAKGSTEVAEEVGDDAASVLSATDDVNPGASSFGSSAADDFSITPSPSGDGSKIVRIGKQVFICSAAVAGKIVTAGMANMRLSERCTLAPAGVAY